MCLRLLGFENHHHHYFKASLKHSWCGSNEGYGPTPANFTSDISLALPVNGQVFLQFLWTLGIHCWCPNKFLHFSTKHLKVCAVGQFCSLIYSTFRSIFYSKCYIRLYGIVPSLVIFLPSVISVRRWSSLGRHIGYTYLKCWNFLFI